MFDKIKKGAQASIDASKKAAEVSIDASKKAAEVTMDASIKAKDQSSLTELFVIVKCGSAILAIFMDSFMI